MGKQQQLRILIPIQVFVKPQYADEIIKWFDCLCPYDNVDHLLKKEEENIWFYGISAKRYVLYDIDEKGNFIIKDKEGEENFSLHALGHLLNPFGQQVGSWHKTVWLDILSLHYGKITIDDFLNKYRNYYAISKFVVSTYTLMKRFEALNEGKDYDSQIKPFNFFLTAYSTFKEVKPIGSFSKNPQAMPYSKFINYKTGQIMEGQQYFMPLADELYNYIKHPESKMDGTVGLLHTKHVTVTKTTYLGKEANRIEETRTGLSISPHTVYDNPKQVKTVLSYKWNDVKGCGISKSQFYLLKKQLKQGKRLKLNSKTLRKLNSLRLSDKNDLQRWICVKT